MVEAKSDDVQVFDLGYKKRVQVKKYQGQIFIDIREYFSRDFIPDLLPTKKGVVLTPEIWRTLMAKADEINQAIEAMSTERLERQYGTTAAACKEDKDTDDEETYTGPKK